MQYIKRIVLLAVVSILILSLPTSLSAANATKQEDNQKILTLKKSGSEYQLGRSNDTACFWEFPILTQGQMRSDGTLIVKSDIEGDADIDLVGVTLPYGNTDAFAYLNALNLYVVDDKGEVIYDDTYAHVGDRDKSGNLKGVHITMKGGESKTYYITLSCDYGFSGKPALKEPIVYKYVVDVGSPAWMEYAAYIAIGIAVLVVIAVIFIILNSKKKSFGADNFDDT